MARRQNTSEDLFKALASGEVAPVYLFYGEDGAALGRAVRAVEKAVVEEGTAEFNSDYFHGKEADPSEVKAAASTMPMMASRRLVVFKRIDEHRVTSRGPILAYLASVNPSTVLVITANEIKEKEGGKENSDKALVAAVAAAGGMAVNFKRPYADKMPAFIDHLVREQGKKIEPSAVHALIDLAGDDTLGLEQQVAKLAIYVEGRDRITEADVIEAAADIREAGVYEFTDAIGDRDLDHTLRMYRLMRAQGQEQLPILGMIGRHFRLMVKIRDLMDKGANTLEASRKCGLNEWIFKKSYLPRVKRYKPVEIGRVFKIIADLDMKLKSASGDKEALFERSLMAIVSGRLL